jgi:Tfp pilus assembly protein PilN
MRPVNLMPPEERGSGGGRSPLRTGAAPYVVLAGLALGLLGIVALAMTSKGISDKRTEKQQLESDLAAATAKAESLRAFADFRAVQESRTATVSSLAQSRFDWERVLNELSRVMPADVWLIEMTGTVSPGVQIDGGAEVQIRDGVEGPALEIVGCASSQDAVAGFVAALEDIDGVTRVGLGSSELSDEQEGGAAAPSPSGGGGGGGGEDCRTEAFITKFEIVVAFDAVPVPATATAAPAVPAPAAPAPSSPAGPDTSQVSDGVAQEEAGREAVNQGTAEAEQAANIVPGGG